MPRQEGDGCWLYNAQNEGVHAQRLGRCIKEERSRIASEEKARKVRREECLDAKKKKAVVRIKSIHSIPYI